MRRRCSDERTCTQRKRRIALKIKRVQIVDPIAGLLVIQKMLDDIDTESGETDRGIQEDIDLWIEEIQRLRRCENETIKLSQKVAGYSKRDIDTNTPDMISCEGRDGRSRDE
jgi:hypothetical protein